MSSITSRERVMLALDHQEPDRVPVALGGGPYGVVDSLYFKLLDHFGLGQPVAPFRSGHNISYMDDRLLERLGIDTRYIWPGASPSSPIQEVQGTDTFLDGYGQVWKRALPYYYPAEGILTGATRLEQIDEIVRWPDVNDLRWTSGVRQRARSLRETGEHYVAARMVVSHGPFQTACDLRGTENFLMDMAANQDFAHRLLDRVEGTLTGLMQGYLLACGEYIDMIELPGDDYAGNTNLVISPAMFRTYIKPILKRLVGMVKDFRPDLKVMLHSDGSIQKLLPDLVEIGVDVVHPLEPLPAMDLAEIKASFGDRLCFLGGIDISHAMPGSLEDVLAEVRLRIAQLAPGGGYILAPSNHLQADIPPVNVAALFEAARQHGRYPILAGRLASAADRERGAFTG
jgi:uroporphyrinogen decarboxylase